MGSIFQTSQRFSFFDFFIVKSMFPVRLYRIKSRLAENQAQTRTSSTTQTHAYTISNKNQNTTAHSLKDVTVLVKNRKSGRARYATDSGQGRNRQARTKCSFFIECLGCMIKEKQPQMTV